MEGIDAVLYINLEHRSDRKEHLLKELSKFNLPEDKVYRIDAIKHNIGQLGCAKSHVKALEFAQSHSEWERVLVLEDDFTFRSDNEAEIDNKIKELLYSHEDIEVGVLSFNPRTFKYENTEHKNIKNFKSPG